MLEAARGGGRARSEGTPRSPSGLSGPASAGMRRLAPRAFPAQTSAAPSRRRQPWRLHRASVGAQGRKKTWKRREGSEERDELAFSSSDAETPLSLMNVQGSGGVTSLGALWVSRRVGFQGLGTPRERGREGPQMDEEGGGGGTLFFPALSCDSRACGGSCSVCVRPRPSRPVQDGGSSSEASLELLEGVRAFFFFF